MERKKPGRKSKSGLKKESGRWRPTPRQMLWAIGMVVTLGTIALLVVQLYPGLWEDVSRGRVATLLGIGVALTVLIVLLAMGSASLGWTGFRGKTLWDVLQLLIVPLVLVGIGLLFEMQQAERENQRAEAERELAEQRVQDEALQACLDQLSNLLLQKNLREAEAGTEVRTLARARTLTVLSRLDAAARKERLLQFLYEAGLLRKENRVIKLTGADLSGIDLHRNNLSGTGPFLIPASGAWGGIVNRSNAANLSGAILSDASLEGAVLSDTDLSETDLRDADLILLR